MAGTVSYSSIISSGPDFTNVLLSDGTTQTFSGSRGWRNNNPGNLTNENKSAATLARYEQFGVLGYDYGGNMIFSTMQGGLNAQRSLVLTSYGDSTIGNMLNIYAPPGAANDPYNTNASYPAFMQDQGWDLNTRISDLTPEQQNQLILDMIAKENGLEYAERIREAVNAEDIQGTTGDDYSGQDGEGEDTVSDQLDGAADFRNEGLAPTNQEYGFKDPDGMFGQQTYESRPHTNSAARGEWESRIRTPGACPFEIQRDAQPEYPNNKVTESTNPNPDERHRIELDDTKGGERVTITHANGSGIEMWNNGELIVNAFGRMVQISGADFDMFVNGNGQVIYNGNLDLTVKGDMNLTVDGDMKTHVKGNKTEIVEKSNIEEYQDDHETTVTNNQSVTVGQTSTELVLGNRNSFVKKDQSNWVEGNAEMLTSGNMHMSSETKTSISSPTLNMASSGCGLKFADGVIGSDNTIFYGKGAVFTEAVKAQTFHGDLKGTAQTAATSLHQSYSDGSGTGYTPSVGTQGTITDVAHPSVDQSPDSASINTILTATEEGINQVSIDPGNKIRQSIDIRERVRLGLGL